ncbi:MAG: ABC transporter ATP-binding protein [Clostridia bacterium]|nr:ABC transporter ATP-binding protein [Clostridia bacterium]
MNRKQTIKTVLSYLRPYWGYLFLSLSLALVTVALTLYVPILTGQAVDQILGVGDVNFPEVFKILVSIAASVSVTALAQWGMSLCNNRLTFGMIRDIRRDAFKKISVLPLRYIDSRPVGDLVSRVISDVDTLADGLLMGFTQLFTGCATILGTLAIMLFLYYRIALVVILVTPISLFVASFIAKRTYSMFQRQSTVRGEQTALIDEMIGEQKLVLAFAYEERAKKRFSDVNERLRSASLQAIFYSSLMNPSTRFVNSLVYAGVGLVGALAVISGCGFTVGLLSSFLSYANQYTKPFNEISGVVTELQNALACAARTFELIRAEEESQDSDADPLPETVPGNVSLDHVYFSYHPDQSLIEDLTLSVSSGQRIAIVGPTGCGKTTVINLLMRFYDPVSGSVKVEQIDVREISRYSLRKNYGMVLQETWLKSGTVRENIAVGKPNATEDEIISAAKASHAHSFIMRLPNGYDTPIGEAGDGLSQGQKQLLCIARVMLCRPPMLILDEATSSIDTRTEHKIQRAFSKLMEGRTSFIVAHRLSTVREADCILVMRDGKVIEQGTHSQLLARNGFYAQLYQSQFAH